jgi:hypothetical protein
LPIFHNLVAVEKIKAATIRRYIEDQCGLNLSWLHREAMIPVSCGYCSFELN